jgi:hypothetical protein
MQVLSITIRKNTGAVFFLFFADMRPAAGRLPKAASPNHSSNYPKAGSHLSMDDCPIKTNSYV